MVEVSLIDGLERVLCATIKSSGEFNGGVCAAKNEKSALVLQIGCRISYQDPNSRAARAFFVEAAALQAASWVLQSPTEPEREPEFTAVAQALFWT
jgi:hypothetical protein